MFIYLFIYLAVLCLSCSTWDLHCGMQDFLLWHAGSSLRLAGFSLVVVWALECAGSVVAAHGLSSCGARAVECADSVAVVCRFSCPAACGILVPWSEIQPAFPALEGGFLTTGPPGKSLWAFFFFFFLIQEDGPGSSYTFPISALDSAITLKSPASF